MHLRIRPILRMPTDAIKRLVPVVARLQSHEAKLLRGWLEQVEQGSRSQVPRLVILFDLLRAADDIDSLRKQLKRKLKTDSVHTIKRCIALFNRYLQSSLLRNENLFHEGTAAYDDNFRTRPALEIKLREARVWSARGEHEEASKLWQKVRTVALRYEYYDLLLAALHELLYTAIENEPPASAQAIELEIAAAEKARSASINAKKAYYRTIQNYGFKGNNRRPDPLYLHKLEEETDQLSADFKATGSAIVGFYFYLLRIEFFQAQEHFDKASEYCHHLVDVVRNNPSVYMRRRLGIAYLNFSQNEIYNQYFDFALGFAGQAAECFKPNTTNHNLATELGFYANFYAGHISAAGKQVADLLFNEDNQQSAFRRSWRSYLLANVFFVMRENKRVHRTLQATAAIQKDKEGWNLGIRVLTAINLIEMDRLEHSDQQINNLRQFVTQGLKDSAVRERDQLIVEVLTDLRRNLYDFHDTALSSYDHLLQLTSRDGDTAWKIQSPELIPFHKWFEARLNGEHFTPDYSLDYIHQIDLSPAQQKRTS